MTAVQCRVCTATTDSAYLCSRCLSEVKAALEALPNLLTELDTTIARQDVGTDAPLYAMRRQRLQLPGVHYDEGQTTLPATPWPFSWDSASLAWAVRNTTLTWARHLSESRGLPFTLARVKANQPIGPVCAVHVHNFAAGGCAHDRTLRNGYIGCQRLHCAHTSCAAIRRPDTGDTWNVVAWLLRNLNAARYDEAAATIHDEITSTVAAIEQAIDRQDPDIYAGPCDSPDVRAPLVNGRITPTVATCGADLYARLGDEVVKCGACGCEYDLAERKKWLVGQIPDALAVTTVIANALTSLLEPITPSMIRQMAYRCEIVAHGTGEDGRTPLYRVGDVIDVLHRRALRKAAGRGGGKRERLSA